MVLFTVVLTLGRTDFDGVLVGCRDGCFLLLQIKQTLQVEIVAVISYLLYVTLFKMSLLMIGYIVARSVNRLV